MKFIEIRTRAAAARPFASLSDRGRLTGMGRGGGQESPLQGFD